MNKSSYYSIIIDFEHKGQYVNTYLIITFPFSEQYFYLEAIDAYLYIRVTTITVDHVWKKEQMFVFFASILINKQDAFVRRYNL